MTEVTSELIYENLRSMPSRMANMEFKLGQIDNRPGPVSNQLRGVSLDVNAAPSDIANIYQSTGRTDLRLAH